MLGFRFATINTSNMTVSYSDAKTPTEHTEAVLMNECGMHTPYMVIHVKGFRKYDEIHS